MHHNARSVMDRAAQELCHNMPEDRRPRIHVQRPYLGHVAWCCRTIRTIPQARKSPFAPEDLLETGIGVYLRGLGVLPPDG